MARQAEDRWQMTEGGKHGRNKQNFIRGVSPFADCLMWLRGLSNRLLNFLASYFLLFSSSHLLTFLPSIFSYLTPDT
jgi:hypothetical protein